MCDQRTEASSAKFRQLHGESEPDPLGGGLQIVEVPEFPKTGVKVSSTVECEVMVAELLFSVD
jgi:hypothetical protein